MDIRTILVFVFPLTMVANFVHWRFRGGRRFLYFPESCWFIFVIIAWEVATMIYATAFLFGRQSASIFISMMLGSGVIQQLYSIAARQMQPARKSESIWKDSFVINSIIAVSLGILCGAIAILGSSPNPPSWTRPAIIVVGAASGLIFTTVWFTLTFRKEQPGRRWNWLISGMLMFGLLIGVLQEFHSIWARAGMAGCAFAVLAVAISLFRRETT